MDLHQVTVGVAQERMGDAEPVVVGHRMLEHHARSREFVAVGLDVVAYEGHDQPGCPDRPVAHTDPEKARVAYLVDPTGSLVDDEHQPEASVPAPHAGGVAEADAVGWRAKKIFLISNFDC